MAFPVTSILDDFNRADTGPPPSASWTTSFGTGLKVLSNQCKAAASGYQGAMWDTFLGFDVEAYFTIATLGATNDHLEIDLIVSTSGYYVELKFQSGTDRLIIYRRDAGVDTVLGANDTSTDWAAGDGFGVSIVNGVISAYRKPSAGSWGLVTSRSDATYRQLVKPDIYLENTTTIIDDFGGGTIPYAPPPPTQARLPQAILAR